MPTIEALATATPSHRVKQSKLKQLAVSLLQAHAPEHLELASVFDSTGIHKRSLACPLDWYLSSPGWAERSQAFEEVGVDLAEEVARACLRQADLPPSAIDGVLFVNTTGLATPSLEAHLVDRLGLNPSTLRVPIWGLGCAGGVAGMARAGDLARARSDERFLLVSLELCSLAFLRTELSKKMIVASALFGDGAAGVLVTGDELAAQGPRLQASASHVWPDTHDVMGWDIKDAGLDVVFSPEIPDIVEEHISPLVCPFLERHGARMASTRASFHPGGPKVLEAYEQALDLPPDALAASRHVLEDHGNMSSPTALFVLEETLNQGELAEGEDALLAAVGPGFAAELALVTGT